MGWSIEEFSDCFRFGIVFRIKHVTDGRCIVHRLRKKKSVFYEQKPPQILKIGLETIGHLRSLQVGDILFRRESDMEVSILRPGLNMPPVPVRDIDFHHR